ncbi:MAG: AAA family ATPase [Candidatus Nealsonbacteria bacterium]
MIIKKIKIKDFRNLKTFDQDLPQGLIVLKGPNESGKSSLLSAIKLSIFGDATTTSSDVKVQKRWKSDKLFLIELHLQRGKETFILTRDYEDKKNILTLPRGLTLKDKKRIQEKLIELIGLPSEKCFISTICITQDEIKKIDSGLPEIKTLLDEKISGGGVDLSELLKLLEKENRGLKKGGLKNLGPIKKSEDELHKLGIQLRELKNKVGELEEHRIELSRISEKLPKLKENIKIKTKAIENAKKYINSKKHFDELSSKYNELAKIKKRGKTAKEKLSRDSKELNKIEEKLKIKKENLDKGKSFLDIIDKKNSYVKDEKKLLEDIKKIDLLKEEMVNIETKISQKKQIDEKDYNNALSLPKEIEDFEKALSSQGIVVSLVPNKKLKLSFKIDNLPKKTQELKAKNKLKISGKSLINLRVKDLVNIDISNKKEEIQKLFEELRRKKSVLKSLFKRYEVANVKYLKNAWNELRRLEESKSKKSIEYKTILGDGTLEKIKTERKKYSEEIKLLNKELAKLKNYSLTDKEIKVLEKEVERLEKKREELKGSTNESLGALKELKKEDDLKKEQEKVVKELAICKAELDELEMFKCTSEKFIRKEGELKNLKEATPNLEAKKSFSEMVIKENKRIGVEDVAELEEKVTFKEKEIYKLNRKTGINDIVMDMISKARVQTIKDISKTLSQKIGKSLSHITAGKYSKIKLGENLDIVLWSDKKDDWIDVSSSSQELSSGTIDQLYLAARFALTEILVPNKNPPIFMDDPFTHFDKDRRMKTLELCKKLSKNHQVLIFTCHDYCDKFADKILEIAEIT